jgi:hypothetical protein
MKRCLVLGILMLAAGGAAASGQPSDSTTGPASGMELIRGTYTYHYGDKESLVDARQSCKELAVRDAVESYYLFLESTSTVENSVLKQDMVRSVAAGCVKNLRVTDQKEEGRTLTFTVEGEVNPDEVRRLIDRHTAAEPSRDPGTAASIPDVPEPAVPAVSGKRDTASEFAVLLSKYENRIVSMNLDSGRARYDDVLSGLKEMDALLESFSGRETDAFQSGMIRSMTLRNRLLSAFVRYEKNPRARTGARQPVVKLEIRRAAEELEQSIESLNRLTGLTDKQAAARKAWALRCRAQMTRLRNSVR